MPQRSTKRTNALTVFWCLWCFFVAFVQSAPAQPKRIVIAASTLLDGKGRVLKNTRIVIEGSKFVRVDPKAGPIDLTVMPGWIDAHVHITWSFDREGKNAGAAATGAYATLQAAANARSTLMAGFTTVQSVGNVADIQLRDVKLTISIWSNITRYFVTKIRAFISRCSKLRKNTFRF